MNITTNTLALTVKSVVSAAAWASGLASNIEDVSLGALLSLMDDGSLARLTVSDTKGESLSEETSEGAVDGSESEI